MLGTLVAHSGISTQPGAENSELLLTTHFPNSEVTQDLTAPAVVLLVRRSDWRLAARVVTCRRVEWSIDFLSLIKVRGWKAYSRLCC